MGNVISIMNQKGGVGKTATTVHLGAFFAHKGFKTLIIDLDPQCDSSRSLKASNDYDIFDLFSDDNIEENISFYQHTINENLFVMVGSREILELSLKKKDLKNKLDLLKDYFDYILIDCNPHLIERKRVTLNETTLIASDFVIIPTDADLNGITDTNLFIPDVLRVKEESNPNLIVLGILFSKIEVNTKIFKIGYKKIKEQGGELVFDSIIRKDEKMKQSQEQGKTIFEYDLDSNASKDFIKLGEEVLDKIKKYRQLN